MDAVEAITADKMQYERLSSTLDQHKLGSKKLKVLWPDESLNLTSNNLSIWKAAKYIMQNVL